MPRRRATIVISLEGRDKGKTFELEEMPVLKSTDWFFQAMMLLSRGGAEVPSNIFSQGPIGFAAMGLGAVLTGLGKTPFPEVKPLLNQLLDCVVGFQMPVGTMMTNREAIMSQVEEATSIFFLYQEVLSLHLGFSLFDRLQEYRRLVASLMMADPGPVTAAESPPISESSSQAGLPQNMN